VWLGATEGASWGTAIDPSAPNNTVLRVRSGPQPSRSNSLPANHVQVVELGRFATVHQRPLPTGSNRTSEVGEPSELSMAK